MRSLARAIRDRDAARRALAKADAALARVAREYANAGPHPEVKATIEGARRIALWHRYVASVHLDEAETAITRALWARDLGTEPP